MKPLMRLILPVLIVSQAACPDADDKSDTGADSGESGAGGCEPGDVAECTCTDGTPGERVCMASGEGYWPCECGVGSGTGGMDGSGGATASGSGSSASQGDASATSGPGECEGAHPTVEGDLRFCEDGACYCKPTDSCFAQAEADACCDDAVLCGGAACQGSHPLVEGDLRYCDAGSCYCGDLDMDPPLDSCFAADQSDACCPVETVCY